MLYVKKHKVQNYIHNLHNLEIKVQKTIICHKVNKEKLLHKVLEIKI